MSTKSMLLPKAIREARLKRGWTQVDLGQQLGVSQGTISFWERGLEQPALENLFELVRMMPEIFDQLARQEADILARLYQLERIVHGGKCLCQGCGCSAS
jgi:transcriptional regulator with XRE-family HTH domain